MQQFSLNNLHKVLIEFENQNSSKIFGNGAPIVNNTNIYDGVGDTGTALLMNIEFNQEQQLKKENHVGGEQQKVASKKKKGNVIGGKIKKK